MSVFYTSQILITAVYITALFLILAIYIPDLSPRCFDLVISNSIEFVIIFVYLFFYKETILSFLK